MDKNLLIEAEKILWNLNCDVDKAFVKLRQSGDEQATVKNLRHAAGAYRAWYGFAAALADATKRGVYRQSWDFPDRLSNDYERHLWRAMKGSTLPVELPERAKKILAELKATVPEQGPRIVDLQDLSQAERDRECGWTQEYIRSTPRRVRVPSPE